VIAPALKKTASKLTALPAGSQETRIHLLGLIIAIPALLAGARAIATQLYGVKTYAARVLVGAIAALAISALVAAVVPARRAAKVDPMVALRYE